MFTFLFVLSGMPAIAGTLAAPEFDGEDHTFCVPPDFMPPLVGEAGMAKIDAAAAQLRFPFYAVFVERLPASGGSEDDRAKAAVDGLVEDWTAGAVGFDAAESQVFLLAYDPRKYAFSAGGRWRADLGFKRDAHKPHLALFEGAVASSPKDPTRGIIELARSVDEYLIDQTDLDRIASRAAEDRQRFAEEAERRRAAEEAARAERERLEAMEAERERLFEEQMGAMTIAVAKAAAVTLALGVIAVLLQRLFRRNERFKALRREWESIEEEWTAAIGEAKVRYVDQYGKRDGMSRLARAVGKTGDLYRRVTKEADDIYVSVCAIESRVKSLSADAARASVWNLAPLLEAIDGITRDFDFKTDRLNEADLFGKPSEIVSLSPWDIRARLTARFRDNVNGWNRLRAAAEKSIHPAIARCLVDGIDRLRTRADSLGIPRRWLASHPLSGDGDAHQEYWNKMDELRNSDPVAYLEEAECFDEVERVLGECLDRLAAAVKRAGDSRGSVACPPEDLGIVLAPDEDPRLAFVDAEREWNKLAGCLASKDAVEDVEERSKVVCAAYARAADLAARVANAFRSYLDALSGLDGKLDAAKAARPGAAAREAQCRSVHTDERPSTYVREGDEYLGAAEMLRIRAIELRGQARVLDANRKLAEASQKAGAASVSYAEAVRRADYLDAEKNRFERIAAGAEVAWNEASQSIRRYGGSVASLPPYARVAADARSPSDYSALNRQIEDQQRAWENAANEARREHERQERARREAEEDARRRREEAAEQARAAASHASSNWGSSVDSDSKAGDWGGSSGSDSSSGNW